MSEHQLIERIERIERILFLITAAMGRLDLLQEAGFEVELRDADGNVLIQE